jgi:hypothetical protein
MKKIILLAGTASLMLLLIACSNGNSPKSVAENFLQAYSKMNFEEAKKYGTEETGKLMDMMSSLTKLMPDSTKVELKSEIIAEKIDGDKAFYTYIQKGKKGEQTLNLAKVDGKWKVVMSKDAMNGGVDNILDAGATTLDSTSAADADSSAK